MEQTISTTHELLDTYVRLLSQTEHTQQLVLDPEWEVQKVSLPTRSKAESFLTLASSLTGPR